MDTPPWALLGTGLRFSHRIARAGFWGALHEQNRLGFAVSHPFNYAQRQAPPQEQGRGKDGAPSFLGRLTGFNSGVTVWRNLEQLAGLFFMHEILTSFALSATLI
jgi:hypothetical protein